MLQVVFGGELQEKGCNFELKVNTAEDLNRSGSCVVCLASHEETETEQPVSGKSSVHTSERQQHVHVLVVGWCRWCRW